MESDLTIIVVWSLFLSSAVQFAIHGVTYYVLRQQISITAVGPKLRKRELTLAIKAGGRATIDMILCVLVTWDRWLFAAEVRMAIYALAILSVAAAIWYGVDYITALLSHRHGLPAEDATP